MSIACIRRKGAGPSPRKARAQPRGSFASRDEALAEARRLADADQPSRVTIDNGDGIILEEHLFGRDLSQEIGELTGAERMLLIGG